MFQKCKNIDSLKILELISNIFSCKNFNLCFVNKLLTTNIDQSQNMSYQKIKSI